MVMVMVDDGMFWCNSRREQGFCMYLEGIGESSGWESWALSARRIAES